MSHSSICTCFFNLYLAAAAPDEITIPQFGGDSSLEIPIKNKVGQTFRYEIWLLTNSPSGECRVGFLCAAAVYDMLQLFYVRLFERLRNRNRKIVVICSE